MRAIRALENGFARLVGGGTLRFASASNFATYLLAIVASLLSFRVMIALTDTPTVGLWAMIIGFAAMAGAAEMGLGGNLTRYIAARGNVSRRLLARLAAVGAIMCLLPVALLTLAIAWPIYRFAATRPDLPVSAAEVAALTGLALLATFVNAAISIFTGLAEGIGRVAQRSATTMLYNLVALAALWPAVAAMGPVGIGVANLAGLLVQFATILAILVVAARPLPRTVDEDTVGALLRTLFASTMQNFGVVLARLTLEPVARFYVALVGSLTVQAWFELALRVSNQVRAVVLNSLQPLLYIGASDQEGMARRFERPRAFTVRLSALLFLGLACASPVISAVILGRVEAGFILFLIILGAGGALSTNGLPGNFGIAARGEFGLLLRIFVGVAALNVALGGASTLLGGGAVGAVAGLAAALGIKGMIFQKLHARVAEQPFWMQFSGFWPAGLAAVAVGAGLAYAALRLPPVTVVGLGAAACVLLIPPAWTLARMLFAKTP